MPSVKELKKILEPINEKVKGYHQFREENGVIDSDESGYKVLLQVSDNEPIVLSKPSLALFYGDSVLYEQEVKDIKEQRYLEILRNDIFHRNRRNFEEMMAVYKANRLTPFVGAGASISAGLSSWRTYLEDIAKEEGLAEDYVNSKLDSNEYEELLEEVAAKGAVGQFEFYFHQDFDHANEEDCCLWIFPEIFTQSIITTNFDRVIEDCYSRQGLAITEKVLGLRDASSFLKALKIGRRYLLKLHGNIDDSQYRVFTSSEYKLAYSKKDKVDFDYPIPTLLKEIYLHHSLVFIGCSLEQDRTVETFKKLTEVYGHREMADHYAIIEAPGDPCKLREREEILRECNIKPIWFECGEYNKVDEILSLFRS